MDWGQQIIYKSRTDTAQISGSKDARQRDAIIVSQGEERTDGMIVFVDKIADCPIAAGVDNCVENMSYQIQVVLAGNAGNTGNTNTRSDGGGGGSGSQAQSVSGARAKAKISSKSSPSSPRLLSSSPPPSPRQPLIRAPLPEVYLSSRLDVCTSGVVPLTTTSQVLMTRRNLTLTRRNLTLAIDTCDPTIAPYHHSTYHHSQYQPTLSPLTLPSHTILTHPINTPYHQLSKRLNLAVSSREVGKIYTALVQGRSPSNHPSSHLHTNVVPLYPLTHPINTRSVNTLSIHILSS